jgi:aminotransferase in exopolysaccharide biosynthesis
MSEFIPLSVPVLGGNESAYIQEAIDSGWVSSSGPFVDRFEKALATYVGTPQAVACTNGTAALHTALLIAGVEPGDEVIVPTITFIAPINAVHYVGAHPVFMDADDYYNMDIGKTIEFIENHTRQGPKGVINVATGRRIAAVLPVHVFGNAVDLEPLLPVCRERLIPIVEDATEALGTVYSTGSLAGRHAGTIGDIGCYSFNGNKIITTGGGGMLVSPKIEHTTRARYLTTQAKDDAVRYVHHEVGFNYRLTNLQAALGVAQLERLPEFLAVKRRNYQWYQTQLAEISGLRIADTPPYANSNHWMYALQIDDRRFGVDREVIMAQFKHRGIEARPVWYPNHLQRPYVGCQSYRIELAESLHRISLNIPCSSDLQEAAMKSVKAALLAAGRY